MRNMYIIFDFHLSRLFDCFVEVRRETNITIVVISPYAVRRHVLQM